MLQAGRAAALPACAAVLFPPKKRAVQMRACAPNIQLLQNRDAARGASRTGRAAPSPCNCGSNQMAVAARRRPRPDASAPAASAAPQPTRRHLPCCALAARRACSAGKKQPRRLQRRRAAWRRAARRTAPGCVRPAPERSQDVRARKTRARIRRRSVLISTAGSTACALRALVTARRRVRAMLAPEPRARPRCPPAPPHPVPQPWRASAPPAAAVAPSADGGTRCQPAAEAAQTVCAARHPRCRQHAPRA